MLQFLIIVIKYILLFINTYASTNHLIWTHIMHIKIMINACIYKSSCLCPFNHIICFPFVNIYIVYIVYLQECTMITLPLEGPLLIDIDLIWFVLSFKGLGRVLMIYHVWSFMPVLFSFMLVFLYLEDIG